MKLEHVLRHLKNAEPAIEHWQAAVGRDRHPSFRSIHQEFALLLLLSSDIPAR